MSETLKYADDPTAQEIFELAGRALADPADGEARRDFWRFVDKHGDHEWVQALRRAAQASHPHGRPPDRSWWVRRLMTPITVRMPGNPTGCEPSTKPSSADED
jgi:hypothetical protein